MNSMTTCLPAAEHETVPASPYALIIMVENGVVSGILPTGPMEAVVVDLDMLENEDSFEQRMHKSVLPLTPDANITSDDMPALITSIVREYRRPDRRRTPGAAGGAATT